MALGMLDDGVTSSPDAAVQSKAAGARGRVCAIVAQAELHDGTRGTSAAADEKAIKRPSLISLIMMRKELRELYSHLTVVNILLI